MLDWTLPTEGTRSEQIYESNTILIAPLASAQNEATSCPIDYRNEAPCEQGGNAYASHRPGRSKAVDSFTSIRFGRTFVECAGTGHHWCHGGRCLGNLSGDPISEDDAKLKLPIPFFGLHAVLPSRIIQFVTPCTRDVMSKWGSAVVCLMWFHTYALHIHIVCTLQLYYERSFVLALNE